MRWNQLKPWQKKRLLCWVSFFVIISVLFMGYVVQAMQKDKQWNNEKWEAIFKDDEQTLKLAEEYSANATVVKSGTYVETIKEISLKNSNFRVIFVVWYSWQGEKELDPASNSRIYNGVINKKEMIKESYKNGENYQQVRMDVTISKSFRTARFPLESQVLQIYIESLLPVDELLFEPDVENSGVNQNLNITGYNMVRNGIDTYTMQYPSAENNPRFDKAAIHSEVITGVEINRDSWGLYLKCFIALLGTLGWCFLTLFISANHQVNPLGTIPTALFGTVGNIMIGSNLLPDVIELGLVEYVNLYGTIVILGTAVSIIHINRIREHEKDKVYAQLFGQTMTVTLVAVCILGNLIMPVSAYLWGN